jgi:Leucine-rich repeat (LRR) protein
MKNNLLKLTAILLFLFIAGNIYPQQNKVNSTQQKKTGSSQQAKKSPSTKQHQGQETKPVITEFTPEQIEGFRTQCGALVKFFEGTLNFLADKKNPVKEKEIIIKDSYSKFFTDEKVQVEDDLDEKRLVPLYKDIQAYLSDVDFFFRGATFFYTVQDVSVMKNDIGQTYFKVTANRNLKGITVSNDSVNSNKVRYFEINYDDSKQELKIASIYTTKMNERADMRNWWNGLPVAWKLIFGKNLQLDANITLDQVSSFNDTLAMVNGSLVPIDAGRFYSLVLQVLMLKQIDISGNAGLTDLEPLAKLSSLKTVSVANTAVTDLMPLRNLNQLEELDISGTKVISLEPLRYSNHIRSLKMKKTAITTLDVLSGLPALEILDFSNTGIDSLQPLAGLTALKDLRFSDTRVSDLGPLSGLTNLEVMYFIHTPVANLNPLKNLKLLSLVFFDNTGVKSLDVFENIPSIKKIYCDNTKIDPDQALKFMLNHPAVDLVFESDALAKWWGSMQGDWKKVFNLYRKLDNSPSTEQLHHLITLDSLDISGRMAITSLDPVSKLTRLRILDCASTSVTSLEPLKGLMDITRINASNTKISSVQPLSGLTKLTILSIDHTSVSDISPLKSLNKLTFIYADNTGLTLLKANEFMDENSHCLVISQTYENTQWWNELSQAWKEDILHYFGFTGTPDKVQLQKIAGTDKLVINEDPGIISLQPVVSLSRLKELQISGTRISELEPLTRMTQLKILRFPKNPVTQLNPLTPLTNLRELDFSNTQVEDLMPIQNLNFIETLKFAGTPVKNLKYLQNLRNLKVLEFYNTKISNIDVLETLTGLTSLKIFNTKISEKKVAKFKQTHPHCEVVFY